MQYTLYSENDAFLRRRFLALPAELYPPERRTQDPETERRILAGTHPLSPDFTVYPFLALDKTGRPAARCLLTVYPGDGTGYVGFFESADDPDAARTVLDAAEAQARRLKKQRLVGPYDASFWIGYRFRTAGFRSTFTGEPNNRACYPRLWEHCGFAAAEHYFSNHMRVPTEADRSGKAAKRLERFRALDYDFGTMTAKTFDRDLGEIWALLTKLYSSFPGYRPITEAQFRALFAPMRHVLDFDMVLLVRKDAALAAFVICIPNYGTLTAGRITPRVLREIRAIRRSPTEYVIPYMGVAPEHAGLGNALAELLRQELMRRNARSISALIRDGKVTGGFYRVLKTHTSEYVLMAKPLS